MKNYGGRPRSRKIGKRVQLASVLATPVHRRIAEAAKAADRSISREVEDRLERSFRDDEVMAELRAVRDMLARFLANGVGGGR